MKTLRKICYKADKMTNEEKRYFEERDQEVDLWFFQNGVSGSIGFFLEKTTKRGWTMACYHIPGQRIEVFLDRQYWELEE